MKGIGQEEKETSDLCIKIHSPFQLGPGIMAPANMGHCAIKEVATSEYTMNIHKHTPKLCHEGDGSSRCLHWHQAGQSCLSQRNKECHIPYPGAVVQKM